MTLGVASVTRCLLIACLWGLVVAATAGAQDPPPLAACPDQPLAYEGSDDVVREVRALREDVRAACLASRDRLDRAHTDAGQAHDDAGQAHTDAVAIKTAVDAIEPATLSAPGVDDANPAYVRLATSDTEAQNAVDGLRAALWCVAGLLVVVIAGPFLLRTFRA